MRTLTIDPAVPFLIPPAYPIAIVLVGCGGTGSHLAQALARLAGHVSHSPTPLSLTFIDGDTVEAKNVGRQLFSPADVGRNKAQVLATRFSTLFGLRITAVPQMATAETFVSRYDERHIYRIVVGAVDGADGRTAIHTALQSDLFSLWIDCGNHEASGQVCLGTTTDKADLAGAFALGGICAHLPAPSLQYPDLLKKAVVRPRADCADAMIDNAQSLQVNQMMAAMAGQYLYQIVVHRRLTTFASVVDLTTLTMRSTPITAATVAEASGIPLATLTATKKKGRAA